MGEVQTPKQNNLLHRETLTLFLALHDVEGAKIFANSAALPDYPQATVLFSWDLTGHGAGNSVSSKDFPVHFCPVLQLSLLADRYCSVGVLQIPSQRKLAWQKLNPVLDQEIQLNFYKDILKASAQMTKI